MGNQIGSSDWNDEMYARHATPYNGIAGYIEKKRLKRILSLIDKRGNPRILEVGCEAGGLLSFLRDHLPNASFTGMDISGEALRTARKRLGDEIPLLQHDVTQDFDGDIAVADYLICSETLEHIPDAEKAVEVISQLVGEQTTIIITVPIEKYKNQIKKVLTRLGLFNRLFPGIENVLSEWHVQDFSKRDLFDLVQGRFITEHYETILLMHQLVVLKPRKTS